MTTEAVYSSAQVAKMLGVSGGMVRRYAMALEELTGQEIPQHPRDGRRFNQEHVDALVAARRYVAGRQGMSVETGLRLALGLAELPAATLLPTVTDASGTVGAEALKAALGEHIGRYSPSYRRSPKRSPRGGRTITPSWSRCYKRR